MRPCAPSRLIPLAVAAVGLVLSAPALGTGADLPPPARGVAPATPALPPGVLADLLDGKSAEAAAALAGLGARSKDAGDRAYFDWVRAGALRLAGRADDARAVLDAAVKADPAGRWSAKLRAALAAALLEAGRAPEAEAIARAQAAELLAPARKDRLAGVYRDFARRLLTPDDPLVPPDPEAAHDLLLRGRALARGDALRAALLAEAAAASRKAGATPRAIQESEAYLREFPDAAGRAAVKFALAGARLAAGQTVQARLDWSDLAREIAAGQTPDPGGLRVRALYNVARTYGSAPAMPPTPTPTPTPSPFPARYRGFQSVAPAAPPADADVDAAAESEPMTLPQDDTALGLQVAALRRVSAADPTSPLAVKAAFDIGASEKARGRSQAALDSFRALLRGEGFRAETDEAKRLRDERAAVARFEVGDLLRSQGRFDDAIAAWTESLVKDANGPRSADTRRAILDARFARGADLHSRRKFDEARAVWQEFVAQNPLDARVPEALLRIAQSLRDGGKPGEAVAAFEALIARAPGDPQGQQARLELGRLFEETLAAPERAIEQYRKLRVPFWANEARARIAVMEAPALAVVTPRTFRKAEEGHLRVTTRNLERLRFAAYKLDPEAFFRKKLALKGVEALDVGLVAPDAAWSEPVAGYARYKPVEASYPLRGLKGKGPGFWAVKVTDETTLQATTMVLRGDLEAVVSASRDQALVFAQDMTTGRGRKGARVLVSDGKEAVREFTTGADGVTRGDWPRPIGPASALEYLVLDGAEAAGSALGLSDRVAQGLSPRAYLYTERPAYRPGQVVSLRGVVREVEGGRYAVTAGASYTLTVADGQGRQVVSRPVTLSEFGTFHATLRLAEEAPVGTYAVRVARPNRPAFAGAFEVQAYALEKAALTIDLARAVVFRGETVRADVTARYQYGTPLAARPVEVSLPDGRTLRGTTDPAGTYRVEFPTEGFAEDQLLEITARLPGENVSARASLKLAARAFRIDLATDRDLYLDGESFALRAATLDALGGPTGQALTVSVLKRVAENGRPAAERETASARLTTDPKTGRGEVRLKIDDEDGGPYVLRASGADRFGNAVVEDRLVTVSGRKDETKLRILTDRTAFKAGEAARVNLHNRGGAGLALVAWEADTILGYRLVSLAPGDNPLAWDVDAPQFPNFTLAAARMEGDRLDEARLDLRVERDLNVAVRPVKPVVGPGETVELEVTAADPLGRPVAAELSLALVDRALLRLYNDTLPPIGPFFHDQSRTGAFTTTATNAFRYAPAARRYTGAVAAARTGPRPARVPNPAANGFSRAGVPPAPDDPVGAGRPRPARSTFVRGDDLRGGSDDPASKALIARLNTVVPMSFPNETPLEDVIKYIRNATSDPAMPDGLPIYLDPVGLQEAEKTTTSPVTIDLDHVPLKTTLRLLLAQLGLEYRIEDGLLTITSTTSDDGTENLNAPDSFPGGMGGGMGGMGGGMAGMGGGGYGGMGGGMGGMGGGMGGGRGPANPPPTGPAADVDRTGAVEGKRVDRPEPAAAEPPAAKETPPPARRPFVETAYWNPAVVTGKDGKARVTFKAPSALSEYVLTARGVTGADTLAGQTTADLAVRKNLFVDLRTPPVLNEGDRPRFSARVHHGGVRGPARVTLSVYAGGRERVDPKTLELTADGVDTVAFDPFEVPDGDVVRLVLSARAGELTDEVVTEVPIRPWGVRELATASGTSSDDTVATVALPEGRTHEHPEMTVTLAPGGGRLLFELAVAAGESGSGAGAFAGAGRDDTADGRASDLLGAASALKALKEARAGSDEVERLTQRVGRLAGGLVAGQNADGGWAWAGGARDGAPSDRRVSARVVWAIAEADAVGPPADTAVMDRATAYLAQELARSDASDHETRAALLLALSARGKAGFEAVNAENRARDDLSDAALAALALTLARVDRPALAGEVLGRLAGRARTEPAAPGAAPRLYWTGPAGGTGASAVEATALAALAFARVDPRRAELAGALEWLNARRRGLTWEPRTAAGPAVAALAASRGAGEAAADRYRLAVTVNGVPVFRAEVAGTTPLRTVAVPRDALKPGGKNRVAFDVEGRGTFAYSVTLSGFTRDFRPRAAADRPPFGIRRRAYLAAPPEFEGKPLAAGFEAVTDAARFENPVGRVPLGGRARVVIEATGGKPEPGSDRGRDYLVLEEHLPAGASVVDGSVTSNAVFHRVADDVLTLYFPPGRTPETVSYEFYGSHAGAFRVPPPRLRSAADPGRYDLGAPAELRVLSPGEASTDPYRPTPDELLGRGKALYDAGRLREAAAPLETLAATYTLREEARKAVTEMLLYVHLATYEPRKIVADFESIREKSPGLVIPFDRLLVIGRAYADMGEFERAYLGWRALAEASYLEDGRVAEAVRQRGKPLQAAADLIDLWREYPDGASIESDFFGLSRLVAGLAAEDGTTQGVPRADLLAQAVRLVRAFLAQSPRSPLADEAALAWIGDELELRNHRAVVELAARSARLYPKSPLADRFRYGEALARFRLGEDEAARAIATALARGGEEMTPTRAGAVFLLGQIDEAARRPAPALAHYRRVADRFTDAAEAVAALTRRDLALPEVSVVRPGGAPAPADAGVILTHRNVASVEVKTYPVDLMQFYLSRRGLDDLASIDLAGVRPAVETTIDLGDGSDFEAKTRALRLPFHDEGAFLVIARAGGRFASGVVLVTPLDLDVNEQARAGLLRVAVRDAATGARVPGVEVKAIGAGNGEFVGGTTDLRGVFLAEGLRGQATVVARQGARRYALYRGTSGLGGADPARTAGPARGRSAPLEDDLRDQNEAVRRRQIDRFEQRMGGPGGGLGGMQGGGFR